MYLQIWGGWELQRFYQGYAAVHPCLTGPIIAVHLPVAAVVEVLENAGNLLVGGLLTFAALITTLELGAVRFFSLVYHGVQPTKI
jgi:hypothetical protein